MWNYDTSEKVEVMKNKLSLMGSTYLKDMNSFAVVEFHGKGDEKLWIADKNGFIRDMTDIKRCFVSFSYFVGQFYVSRYGNIGLDTIYFNNGDKIDTECWTEEDSIQVLGVGTSQYNFDDAVFMGLNLLSERDEQLYKSEVLAFQMDTGVIIVDKDKNILTANNNIYKLVQSGQNTKSLGDNIQENLCIPFRFVIGKDLVYSLQITKLPTGYRLAYIPDSLSMQALGIKLSLIPYIDLDDKLQIVKIHKSLIDMLDSLYYSDDYNRYVRELNKLEAQKAMDEHIDKSSSITVRAKKAIEHSRDKKSEDYIPDIQDLGYHNFAYKTSRESDTVSITFKNVQG